MDPFRSLPSEDNSESYEVRLPRQKEALSLLYAVDRVPCMADNLSCQWVGPGSYLRPAHNFIYHPSIISAMYLSILIGIYVLYPILFYTNLILMFNRFHSPIVKTNQTIILQSSQYNTRISIDRFCKAHNII